MRSPVWSGRAILPPALLLALCHAGCSMQRAPPSGTAPVSGDAFDPVGRYDLTMSSEGMVSEGTMDIGGEPGRYTGLVAIGGVAARIFAVEAGEDHMTVRAALRQGSLILRLAWDGESVSGNWLMGGRRGTIMGRKRPRQPPGGPVSIGRSERLPHSDQDPS